MKTVTLPEFLTEREIRQARVLYRAGLGSGYAKAVSERIIQPNLKRINRALGQPNDPMYLAYAVEYVMSQTEVSNAS
jgi:hypothetical protein